MRRAVLLGEQDAARGAEQDLLERVGEVGHRRPSRARAGRRAARPRWRGWRGRRRPCRASWRRAGRGRRRRPAAASACGPRGSCARPSLSGRLDRDAAVEAAGAQQRRVEDLGAVGGGQHDHRGVGLEAVHLGEDLVERLLALVVAAAEAGAACRAQRPIASSSSMKMIAGAASLACLKRSRTREAPTPTITSTNSEAEIEKNGTPASPATRAGEQRLAGARAGRTAARRAGCARRALRSGPGARRKSTISVSSALASSIPATSSKVTCAARPRRAARGAAEAAERAPAAARASARDNHTNSPTSRITGPKPRRMLARMPAPWLTGSASISTSLSWRSFESSLSLANVGISVSKLLRRLGVLVARRVLDRLVEHALDGLALRRDALDVPVLDLLDEGRVVGDRHRRLLAVGEHRDERVVEDQQEADDDQEAHVARARHPRSWAPPPSPPGGAPRPSSPGSTYVPRSSRGTGVRGRRSCSEAGDWAIASDCVSPAERGCRDQR